MVKELKIDDTSKFMNGPAAERYAGVSKGYFVYTRGAGLGPSYLKQGHHIYYRKEDLDVWLNERKVFTEVQATKK
jgi:hypothetical protein